MTTAEPDWFKKVRGNEHILLGRDSSLRRLPANVNPKQIVFFDGIRHAVEIMDLGFARLRGGLTTLALNPPEPADLPAIIAGAFLDAWAVVDAVDRFRQLYLDNPATTSWKSNGESPLRTMLQPFRELRNIGQHLGQRSEQVVARGGPALGELSWLTGEKLQPDLLAWHCVLRPGTMRSNQTISEDPFVTTLDWPTDCISLSAGGHQANLSQVRTQIAGRVRHLESQLAEQFARPENAHLPAASDFFGRRPVTRAMPAAGDPKDSG